jgi:nitrite reductase/ring-hydroxylating ferredoxin subunit
VSIAVASNEPLIEGRTYMVPCVHYSWFGREDWWPVIGPRHNDKRFLRFPWQHYHVDGRFLTKRQMSFAKRQGRWVGGGSIAETVAASPLFSMGRGEPAPAPTMKRRKCTSASIPYTAHGQQPIRDLAAHYAGRQCRASEQGWVCPHQQTPLGSIQPVDGVVTCPLHGLRIDCRTGVVLPPGGSVAEIKHHLQQMEKVEVMEIEA